MEKVEWAHVWLRLYCFNTCYNQIPFSINVYKESSLDYNLCKGASVCGLPVWAHFFHSCWNGSFLLGYRLRFVWCILVCEGYVWCILVCKRILHLSTIIPSADWSPQILNLSTVLLVLMTIQLSTFYPKMDKWEIQLTRKKNVRSKELLWIY